MKKIITIIICSFLFMNNVSANNFEADLNTLKEQYLTLQEKVNSFDKNIINTVYPVGSIYITTTYSTVSQVQDAIGGTWEVYGSGRTLVGVNTSDTNFNTVEKTGGSSTTTLSTANLPSHNHSIPALSATTTSAGAHTHSIPALSGTAASNGAHTHTRGTMDITGTIGTSGRGEPKFISFDGAFYPNETVNYYSATTEGSGYTRYDGLKFQASRSWTGETSSNGAHTHSVTTVANTTGSNGAHSHSVTTTANTSGDSGSTTAFTNLQPYITVYMYKRTA